MVSAMGCDEMWIPLDGEAEQVFPRNLGSVRTFGILLESIADIAEIDRVTPTSNVSTSATWAGHDNDLLEGQDSMQSALSRLGRSWHECHALGGAQ